MRSRGSAVFDILLGTALLFWSALLVSTLLDARLLELVPMTRPPPDAPEVAAIVPARNEAHQISVCLRSLLAQDWPRLRVICVDDRSEDQTFAVASAIADPKLTVVRGEELSPMNLREIDTGNFAKSFLIALADRFTPRQVFIHAR